MPPYSGLKKAKTGQKMIFFREKQRIRRPELILLGKKLMQWLQEVNEYNFVLFSFREILPYDLGPLFSGPGNPQKGYFQH